MSINERLWWTRVVSNNLLWYEDSPGQCGSMYFPCATQFMRLCPWLAARVFWAVLQIKRVLNWGL